MPILLINCILNKKDYYEKKFYDALDEELRKQTAGFDSLIQNIARFHYHTSNSDSLEKTEKFINDSICKTESLFSERNIRIDNLFYMYYDSFQNLLINTDVNGVINSYKYAVITNYRTLLFSSIKEMMGGILKNKNFTGRTIKLIIRAGNSL